MRNAAWDLGGWDMGLVLPVLCTWCEELHLSQAVGFDLRVCWETPTLMNS